MMHNITAILLAAGQSQRFGGYKLTHPLGDSTIGLQSAAQLLHVFESVMVVVNPEQPQLQQQYQAMGLEVVINPQAQQGMGTSIATGVSQSREADAWVIALADMPFIQSATLLKLKQAVLEGHSICAPSYQGQRGHPVVFAHQHRDALLALNQDKGAGAIVQQHRQHLHNVAVEDRGVIWDIDTPHDLVLAGAGKNT